MAQKSVLVLNGPNLNMLGLRQPEIYGTMSLSDLDRICVEAAKDAGWTADCRQSNMEGELVGWIHEARTAFDGIVINAGAYTHTSVALRDAISAAETPTIEVHLSNIHKRESFRHHSYLTPVAVGMICGLGAHGYVLGIQALARMAEE